MKPSHVKLCPCQGGSLTRFIQPIILSELAQGPDHGYSIVQKISQTQLWRDDAPDAAGVYRALREMEERGHVTSYLDTDSRAGLGKRVFSITKEGRQCLGSWLRTLRRYRKGVDEIISKVELACGSEGIRLRQESE